MEKRALHLKKRRGLPGLAVLAAVCLFLFQFPADLRADEIDNDTCLGCHNADILDLTPEDLADQVVVPEEPVEAEHRPPYVFGDLTLAIDEEKFAQSIHHENEITCVMCHMDIEEIPHQQRLAAVACENCHDTEALSKSAHGAHLGAHAPTCVGCHDVHYGQGADEAFLAKFEKQACLDCHQAYGIDNLVAHKGLYEAQLHMKLNCGTCHENKEDPSVHAIPTVAQHAVQCEDCHTRNTMLTEEKEETSCLAYLTTAGFTNKDVMEKHGYVIGANRVPLLDTILLLLIIGPLGLPVVHGGLRFITRRKHPVEHSEEEILLHPLLERIWHWLQALCIVILIITGLMIHLPEVFSGWFSAALALHNAYGSILVILSICWVVYILVTGRFRHYLPRKGEYPDGMIRQARFYLYGIFKHEPHPYTPSEDNKFNPLQKLSYAQFQFLFLPLLLASGVVYMFPSAFGGLIDAIGGMAVLGIFHLILGALFAAFLIAHMYLATTGETIGENFKAIILGTGPKPHEPHEEAKEPEAGDTQEEPAKAEEEEKEEPKE